MRWFVEFSPLEPCAGTEPDLMEGRDERVA
jgi:hypothetical protein